MGQAGEQLRRDLDKFARSIPGAKVTKRGNITTVQMPSKEESNLLNALAVTAAEADLLGFDEDEDDY